MSREEIEEVILKELEVRKRGVLNRNALSAFFSMFADPAGALGKIFLGRGEAISNEKAAIEREKMLDILCRLDDVFVDASKHAHQAGVELDGLIELRGNSVDHVTGVDIKSGAGMVRFKPGAHVVAELGEGTSLTGVSIGGENKS